MKMNALLILAVFLAVFSYSISEARQGCCSRHGGVCGCGCCDGTGLSATCAPYYPECNSKPPSPPPIPPITQQTNISTDDQIMNKINSVKSDYPKYYQGFRESLIQDIINIVGFSVDINKIGYFVYTSLPDVK